MKLQFVNQMIIAAWLVTSLSVTMAVEVPLVPHDLSLWRDPEFKRQFKRLAKKYHSLRTDYDDLLNDISDNPFLGDDLGGGVRKVRMAIASKGKGKSGGARILTLNLLIDTESMEVTLLTIYDKGEISNVTDEYIKYLLSNL